MRLSTYLRLIAVGLLAYSVAASASLVSAGPPVPQPQPHTKEQFKGYGPTVTDAEKDAMQKACEWIEKNGGLGWTPNPQYLREHNMVRFVGEPKEEKFERLEEPVKVVIMDLEITKQQAEEIQKQAQVQRMKSRQGISLLVVLGVVGLLAVVGGYLRLEEATKGYYTRLLRVVAVGVLLVIAVVLGLVA
jgi:hypothetical protein